MYNITEKLSITREDGSTLFSNSLDAEPVNNSLSEHGYLYELPACDEEDNLFVGQAERNGLSMQLE